MTIKYFYKYTVPAKEKYFNQSGCFFAASFARLHAPTSQGAKQQNAPARPSAARDVGLAAPPAH
jgi:hypothetical protein